MKRRAFVKVMFSMLLLPIKAIAAEWNRDAFEAKKLIDAQTNLSVQDAIQNNEIEIIAADKAENGAVVQVEVISHLPNSSSIALFVEHNPTPLIAKVILENGSQSRLVTRIKMAETSDIKAVIKVGNQYYMNSKHVVVLEDGCGGSDSEVAYVSSMKMRAKLVNQTTEVKVIITHPMTTGRSKNSAGEIISAHFIQQINVTLNGKSVLDMQCGTGIAKNPYLTFYVEGAKVGDIILVNWLDNNGNVGHGETTVIV